MQMSKAFKMYKQVSKVKPMQWPKKLRQIIKIDAKLS